MDPITTAIMAVLPGLASDTLNDAVKSAYEGLKTVIRRKWGETAPISKAITAAEEDPTSKSQASVLAEKVEAAKANDDADVLKALQELVTALKAHDLGGEAVARIQLNITGGTQPGIIGAGNGLPTSLPAGTLAALVDGGNAIALASGATLTVFEIVRGPASAAAREIARHSLPGSARALADSALGIAVAVDECERHVLCLARGQQVTTICELPGAASAIVAGGAQAYALVKRGDTRQGQLVGIDLRRREVVSERTLSHTDMTLSLDQAGQRILIADPLAKKVSSLGLGLEVRTTSAGPLAFNSRRGAERMEVTGEAARPPPHSRSCCCCVCMSPTADEPRAETPLGLETPSGQQGPQHPGAGQPGGNDSGYDGQTGAPGPGGGTVVGNGSEVTNHPPGGGRVPCGRNLFWKVDSLQQAGGYFLAADRSAQNVALLSADMNLVSEWRFERGGALLLATEESSNIAMYVRGSKDWVLHDVHELVTTMRPALKDFTVEPEETKTFIGQRARSHGQSGAPTSISAVLLPVIETGQVFSTPNLSGFGAFIRRTMEAEVRDYYHENSFGSLNDVTIKVFGVDVGPAGGPLQLPRKLADYFYPVYVPATLELAKNAVSATDEVIFDGREALTIQATPLSGGGSQGTLTFPFYALGLKVDLTFFPAQVKFLGTERLELQVTTPAGAPKTLKLTFPSKTFDIPDLASVNGKLAELATYLDDAMKAAEAAVGVAPRLFAVPKAVRIPQVERDFGRLLVTFGSASTSGNRLEVKSATGTAPGGDPLGLTSAITGTIKYSAPGQLETYLINSALLAQEANPGYDYTSRILNPPTCSYDVTSSRLTTRISIADRYGGPGAEVKMSASSGLEALFNSSASLSNSATTLNDATAVRDLEDLLRDAYTAANDRLRQPGQSLNALDIFGTVMIMPVEPPTPKFGVQPAEMWSVMPLGRPFDFRGVEWPHTIIDRNTPNVQKNGTWALVFIKNAKGELNVSVVCHELGHAIGFGDLYWQTGYRNELAYMGPWSMMDDDPALSHHCGYHKLQANWIPDGAGTPEDYGRVFPIGLPRPARTITRELLLVPIEIWHNGLETAARKVFGVPHSFPVAQLVWIDLGGDGAVFSLIEAREHAKNSAGYLHFSAGLPGDGGILITQGITWRLDDRFAVNNFYRRSLHLLNPANILRNPGDQFDLALAPELAVKGVKVEVIRREVVLGDTEVYHIKVTRDNAEFVDLYFDVGDPYYKSPDLWVDWWGNNQPKPENYSPDYPLGQPTDQGETIYVPNQGAEPHWLVARLRNRGQVEARDVKLNFFYLEPPGGGDGGKPLNTKSRGGLRPILPPPPVFSVPGGGIPQKAPVRWDVPAGFSGHTCILVEIEDYKIPRDAKGAALGSDDVWLANNHAQKNVDKYEALSASPFAPIEFDFSVYNGGLTPEVAFLEPEGLPYGMRLTVTRYLRKIRAGETAIFHCRLELDESVIRTGCENDQRFRIHAWRKDAESSARWGGVEYEIQPREKTVTTLSGAWYSSNQIDLGGKVVPSPGGGTIRIRLAFSNQQSRWVTVPLTSAGTFSWSDHAPAGSGELNAVARFEGNRKFGAAHSNPYDLRPPPPLR